MASTFRNIIRRFHPEGIPWPGSLLYDAVSRTSIFTQHYQMVADDVARYCHHGRVLDVGTGPGWLLLALQRSLPNAQNRRGGHLGGHGSESSKEHGTS